MLFEEFDLSWQDRAACRGMNPDLFFPARGEETRQAKKVCARCPVREECLDFALENAEKFGIWGGLSERERRGERRRRGGVYEMRRVRRERM